MENEVNKGIYKAYFSLQKAQILWVVIQPKETSPTDTFQEVVGSLTPKTFFSVLVSQNHSQCSSTALTLCDPCVRITGHHSADSLADSLSILCQLSG